MSDPTTADERGRGMTEEERKYRKREGGLYPVDPQDPVGSRAHDELMRICGMGKYADHVQGGPPNHARHSIPAREDYDTDCVIGAALRERTALRKSLAEARGALQKIADGVDRTWDEAACMKVASDALKTLRAAAREE